MPGAPMHRHSLYHYHLVIGIRREWGALQTFPASVIVGCPLALDAAGARR